MNITQSLILLSAALGAFVLEPVPYALASTVYQTDFNALSIGHTTNPSTSGQDGWFSAAAVSPAFGEIESAIAVSGNALHEFTGSTNGSGQQTIDVRPLTPPDLNANPLMTLNTSFFANSSDLSRVNNYAAALRLTGTAGNINFTILGFNIGGGNGTAKSQTGINVSLAAFNGSNNNQPITLSVGQHLTWDSWHTVTLIGNQASDHYVSLTVDGQTQDLSAFLLQRDFPGGVPTRGQSIQKLEAQILGDALGGVKTDDNIYWDNVSATVAPEPSTWALLAGGLGVLSAQRWHRQSDVRRDKPIRGD